VATQVVLLRGINVGSANRVAMPALRTALTGAGHGNVRTYVQSGNIVLDSELGADDLAAQVGDAIEAEFGLQIPVVTRTHAELAAVVEANPLGAVASEPKRYQVSFLDREPGADAVARLQDLAEPPEALAILGREIYAWHPDGVARSKLWNALAARGGVGGATATARNWTTVTTLLEMAADAG